MPGEELLYHPFPPDEPLNAALHPVTLRVYALYIYYTCTVKRGQVSEVPAPRRGTPGNSFPRLVFHLEARRREPSGQGLEGGGQRRLHPFPAPPGQRKRDQNPYPRSVPPGAGLDRKSVV